MYLTLSIYVLPLLAMLIGGLLYSRLNGRSRRGMYCLCVALTVFVYCGVWFNGNDWKEYLKYWDNLALSNLGDYSQGIEYGFYLLMLLCKNIGMNFFTYVVLCKMLSFIVISYVVWELCGDSDFVGEYGLNPFYLLLLLLGFFGLYLYVETLIRFDVALAIVALGYKRYVRGELMGFIYVVFAMMFHRSMVVLIPLFFIQRVKVHFIVYLIALLLLLYLGLSGCIYGLIPKQETADGLGNIMYWLNYYASIAVIGQENNHINVGAVVFLILFMLIGVYSSRLVKEAIHGRALFNGAMMFFVLSFASFYLGSVSRIAIVFVIPMSMAVIQSLRQLAYKNGYTYLFACLLLVCYLFIRQYVQMQRSVDVYVPYTNYFIGLKAAA